jgi:hypothetical protein
MKIFSQDLPDTSSEEEYRKRPRYSPETNSTQVLALGIAPSGASVLWRIQNYRPYFFIRVDGNQEEEPGNQGKVHVERSQQKFLFLTNR